MSKAITSAMDMYLMQTIDDASWLTPGMIVHHQPRSHYYRLIYRTMIKGEKSSGKSWEYGWAYREVLPLSDGTFADMPESEIYSRPDSLFDSDWRLAY